MIVEDGGYCTRAEEINVGLVVGEVWKCNELNRLRCFVYLRPLEEQCAPCGGGDSERSTFGVG